MRNKKLILILFLALWLRLSTVFIAHHGDLNNNISWGTLAVERGLSDFYEGKTWPYSAPNQPPLTILMFAGLRLIWRFVENISWWLNRSLKVFPSAFIWFWEDKGMDLMVKLPGILADLGIAWLIYTYFRDRRKLKVGLILSAVWLFNPVTWYVSSVWGQTDAVVNFLGLAAVFFILRRKLALSLMLFTLSLLFKGSLLIFAPILIFVIIKQRYSKKQIISAIFYGLLATICVSVWFHPRLDFIFWLANLYQNRILPGEIGYLTANAFNFWWLVDSGKTLDSTVFLGLPARWWGFLIFFFGLTIVFLWLRKKFSEKRIFLSLTLLSLVSFLFMTRIHERYLYPFFPYATILLGTIGGFWSYYLVLSVTYLLNLYHLFWIPSFFPLEALYSNAIFPRLISIINLFFLWVLLRHLKTLKI